MYFKVPTESKVSKFVGRKHLLEEIATCFAPAISSQCTTPIKLALFGMGGIGKSQIALEYCFQEYSSKRIETVFWINAHSEESVVASLTKVAALIGQSEQRLTTAEEKVEYVMTSLQVWPCPFLLVFDNYDDPEFDNILQYTPAVGTGAILFTSRLFATGDIFESSIAVDVMDPAEALDLLKSRCGLKTPLAAAEEDNAKEVVSILDGLPLAIDQAGAYIRASGSYISFRRFLDHYSQRRKDILQYVPRFWQYKEATDKKEKGRHLSVYTTWDLSLKFLGLNPVDHIAKTHFLTLAAFIGGHRVSRTFFKTYCSKAGANSEFASDWMDLFRKSLHFDDFLFRDVIVELNNLSLIRGFVESDWGDLHFSLHPIVREWIIFRIDINQQVAFTSEVNRLMLAFFDTHEGDFSTAPDVIRVVSENLTKSVDAMTLAHLASEMLQEIIAHVHACINLSNDFGPKLDGSTKLELYYGSMLGESGEIEAAVELWEKVLEHEKRVHGPRHPGVFPLMIDIFRLWTQHKIRTKGRESMEALLFQMETNYKADHPDTLLLLSHLCTLYAELGETGLARTSIVKLKNAVQTINLDRSDSSLLLVLLTARLLANTLAFTHSEKRQLMTEADKILNKAVEVLLPNDSSPEARLSRFILCDVRLAQYRPTEAEIVMRDFLSRERARHGSKMHQDIIMGELSLARCHIAQRHWKAAAEAITPVYNFLSEAVGLCYDLTSDCAIGLALLWVRIHPRDLCPSDEIIDRLLSAFRNQFGSGHLRTLQIQLKIVTIYLNSERYETAFGLLYPLYKLNRDSLEPENEARLAIEEQYAYVASKLPDQSTTIVQNLINMYTVRQSRFEAQHSPKGSLAVRNRGQYAIFLSSLGRYDETLILRKTQTDLLEEKYGSDSEEFRDSAMDLAICYENLGRWSEALDIYGKIPNLKGENLGIANDLTLKCLLRYARINERIKDYAAAERQHAEVLRCRTAEYGPDDERAIECLSYLAHSMWNQPNPAKKAKSEAMYFRLVEWYGANHSPDSQSVTLVNEWLGNCLSCYDKHAEAAKYYRKVVDLNERNCGLDHDATMESLHSLVKALHRSNDFTGALQLFPRVLDWLNRTKGPTDEETLGATFLLGDTYIGLQRFAEARDIFIDVLHHRETINGPSDDKTMWAVSRLADVLSSLGKLAKAESYAVRLLEHYKACGNTSDEVLIRQAYFIGCLRLRQGKANEAEEDIMRSLAWKTEHLGLENQMTLRAYFWHAQCQYALERYETAMEHYALVVKWKDRPDSWEQFYQEAVERLALCKSRLSLTNDIGRLEITE